MNRPTADHWILMVLALAGELVPPEPVRPGPARRHRPSDTAPDGFGTFTISSTTPEPASFAMSGLCLLAVGALAWHRRARASEKQTAID